MTVAPRDVAHREPIAIVGLGCRLPGGANGPEAFWRLLLDGVDAVTEVPPDRWDMQSLYHPDWRAPGRIHQRHGGFVDHIDAFDAAFFGISPREAKAVDPQQRMLLETAHQALENAGIPPFGLAGSKTGVFVGISTHDYLDFALSPSEWPLIGPHTNQGGTQSIAANRLSYVFDLHGPSVALDTACSSSLTALHLAAGALRQGDCDLALVGGVNALLGPGLTIGFSKGRFLSPSGRCRAFSAEADGFVRAEGAGMLVVESLSRARRLGHRILAVVRHTAVNQDGRTTGMSLPNEEAQAALLQAAYEQAGLLSVEVDYVEAHGTGTKAGDPIEARAMGRMLGRGRRSDDPLLIGSAKTNVGHLEAGAGAVGLLKTVLALQHGVIPASLHAERLNPQIPFDELKLRVVREHCAWPERGPVRRAGVSSFGFGGSNAHAVLEWAPGEHQESARHDDSDDSGPVLLTISARSPGALCDLARAHRALLEREEGRPRTADVAWTTVHHRDHHRHRAALVVSDVASWQAGLEAVAAGESFPGVLTGRAARQTPRVAFVCSGQGPQWWGMGRELMRDSSVFRRTVGRIAEAMAPHATWSLLEELGRDATSSRVHETWLTQPTLFALQIGLAECWRELGVEPDAVVGHSVGEVSAAVIAGALSLEQGAHIIVERGRIQQKASGTGRMLAVGIDEATAQNHIARYNGHISIAAINRPELVAIAGEAEAIEALAKELTEEGTFNRFVAVKVPFHSHLMEPLEGELNGVLGPMRGGPTSTPMYSTVTAGPIGGDELGGDYWYRNVRQPVRFVETVRAMTSDGLDVFVELSPHPILSPGIEEVLASGRQSGTVLATLRRGEPELPMLLRTLGGLYVAGCDARPAQSGRRVELPSYPWQRQRSWCESSAGRQFRAGQRPHPFIRRHVSSRTQPHTHLFDLDFDPRVHHYLSDHRIEGALVLPGAASFEAALACGRQAFGRAVTLRNVQLERPFLLPDGDSSMLDARLEIDGDDGRFGIAADDGDGTWTGYVSGRIDQWEAREPSATHPVATGEPSGEPASLDDGFYLDLDRRGYGFGPAFRRIGTRWYRRPDHGALAETVGMVQPLEPDGALDYVLHPAVLDSCFQAIVGMALEHRPTDTRLAIPAYVEQLSIAERKPTGKLMFRARLLEVDDNKLSGDAWLVDEQGCTVAEVTGFEARFVGGRAQAGVGALAHHTRWVPSERPESVTYRTSFGPDVFDTVRSAWEVERGRIEADPAHGRYAELDRSLDELALGYAVDALQEAGVVWEPGWESEWPLPSLANPSALADRLVAALRDAGFVELGAGRLRVRGRPLLDATGALESRLDEYADFADITRLVQVAGKNLVPVITGQRKGVDVLFSGETRETLTRFYREGYQFRYANRWVVRAFDRLLRSCPDGQIIRVLEVGAGTAGTTAHLASYLEDNRVVYTFTDVSASFLSDAELRFGHNPGFRTALLDLERSALDQGFEPHSFDIIIAADVLHAVARLAPALEGLKELLGRGGALLLLEHTRPTLHLDLVLGLFDGWWRFEDHHLRSDHCALSAEAWCGLLRHTGLDPVLRGEWSDCPGARQTVFLARAGDSSQGDARGLDSALESRRSVAVVGEPCALGDDLADGLGARACSVQRVPPSACGEISDSATHVVLLVPSRAFDGPDLDADGLKRLVEPTMLNLVEALKVVADRSDEQSPAILIVTTGAFSDGTSDGTIALGQRASWGVGRVLANEFPELRVRLIDCSPAVDADEVHALAEEVLSASPEVDVMLRGTGRFTLRVEALDPTALEAPLDGRTAPSYRLRSGQPGLLSSLHLESVDRVEPGLGEIAVRVEAAGLNFRDVMRAMGLLPPGAASETYGMECAGTVVTVGSDVRRFAPGDEVVALGFDLFGGTVVVPSSLVWHRPATLSAVDAAAIPVVFGTAQYALIYLARVQEGERVLIHSASGGVGLAALQIARRAGARVMATAGTAKKRSYLESLGVDAVSDSRALTWFEEVKAWTAGRGVDVVLNSLSGSAIGRGLASLSPYGRFVELGKTDIFANSRLGLRAFRENISFFAVDLERVIVERPQWLGEHIIEPVIEAFAAGQLQPLPTEATPIQRMDEAFRTMSQARHIGKLVVTVDEAAPIPVRQRRRGLEVRQDRTYIVTGGTRGLGLALAERLIQRGARHLLLLSRTGGLRAPARGRIAEWARSGVSVQVRAVDVADTRALASVLSGRGTSFPPIGGVAHAAMALADAPAPQQDAASMWRALGPKAGGALNLHHLTLDQPLDWFILFSSVSAIAGIPGQVNYNAANSFVEGLAGARRRLGLPATAISLGALGDVGFVARNDTVRERLHRVGLEEMPVDSALDLIEQLAAAGLVEAIAGRTDWEAVASSLPSAKNRLRRVLPKTTSGRRADSALEGPKAGLAPADRQEQVAWALRGTIAGILGSSPDLIPGDAPITELGIDSLVTAQLVSWLRHELGVTVSSMRLLKGPSIDELAGEVVGALG